MLSKCPHDFLSFKLYYNVISISSVLPVGESCLNYLFGQKFEQVFFRSKMSKKSEKVQKCPGQKWLKMSKSRFMVIKFENVKYLIFGQKC